MATSLAAGYRASGMDDTGANLAANVRRLREARGLSQQQMAQLSGIPRPTWASLETGAANPTLAVLLARRRRAAGLDRGADRSAAHGRAALPRRRGAHAQAAGRAPAAASAGSDRRPRHRALELEPGGHLNGIPHTPGTREYLTCESRPHRARRVGRALAARRPATRWCSAATSATSTAISTLARPAVAISVVCFAGGKLSDGSVETIAFRTKIDRWLAIVLGVRPCRPGRRGRR